jgi:hypothetical protein
MASTTNETAAAAEANQDPLECEVGIAKYLSPDVPGFFAVLKARYSDFVVHEGMCMLVVLVVAFDHHLIDICLGKDQINAVEISLTHLSFTTLTYSEFRRKASST